MDIRIEGKRCFSRLCEHASKISGNGHSYSKADLRLRIRRVEFELLSQSKGKFLSHMSPVVSHILQ